MAHINELIDYTVEVFIVHKNKVLFRYHDKYNLWLSVGGHIELDENPNEAAVREVKEEVGLDVVLHDKLRPFMHDEENYKELIPPYFMNIHKVSDTHRHVTLNYFATSDSDHVVEESHDKSGKCKWMTKEEIEADDEIHYMKKIYALRALEELSK
jgi:8-oxo-dGTP pyrophosphatase MutT (NUDIX family)